MTYYRPTYGLDKDARLHVEGVMIVQKEKQARRLQGIAHVPRRAAWTLFALRDYWGSLLSVRRMTITIYTKPGCQQCVATKRLFEKAGHAPAFIDITKDTSAENHVRALGYLSLPVVYIDNNNHWFGFRPDLIGEVK